MPIHVASHLNRAVAHESLEPLGREPPFDAPSGEEVAQCVRSVFRFPGAVDYLGMTLHYIERALHARVANDGTASTRKDEIQSAFLRNRTCLSPFAERVDDGRS